MFIIFGSPRSGTTLLSETLNIHPEIYVPTETDFIVPAAFLIDRIKDQNIGKKLLIDLILNSNDSRSITSQLKKDQIESIFYTENYNFCSIINAIYNKIAENNKKKLAGDKSPNDLMYPQIFETVGLFQSDIKFIHIIRNIRDICESLMGVSWAPKDICEYFPRIWSFSNCHIHQLLKDKPNYYLIKYEELTSSFTGQMGHICNFLGVCPHPVMFNHEIRAMRLGALPHNVNLNKQVSDVINKRMHQNRAISKFDHKIYEQASEGIERFGYL